MTLIGEIERYIKLTRTAEEASEYIKKVGIYNINPTVLVKENAFIFSLSKEIDTVAKRISKLTEEANLNELNMACNILKKEFQKEYRSVN